MSDNEHSRPPSPPPQGEVGSRQASASRHPSASRQAPASRHASASRRRGRSATPRSSVSVSNSDSESESPQPQNIRGASASQGPRPPQNRNRRGKNRRGQGQQGGLPGIEEVEGTGQEVARTGQGAVDTTGKTANQVAGQGGGGKQDDDSKPLKLRLDLNLDVAVELKAKVHGDVTLSLLAPGGNAKALILLYHICFSPLDIALALSASILNGFY